MRMILSIDTNPARLVTPDPIAYLWHVLQICTHVRVMFNKQVFALLYEGGYQLLHTMRLAHGLNAEVVATHAVTHYHIKRCGRGAFFYISTHVEARGVRSSVNHFVDGPLIAMKGKYDRRIQRKVLNKSCIFQ